MCGIAGLLCAVEGPAEESLRAAVLAMTGTLAHRGPDDSGVWIDAPAGVALGHRRLSILDLSPAGHQPMASSDGQTERTEITPELSHKTASCHETR